MDEPDIANSCIFSRAKSVIRNKKQPQSSSVRTVQTFWQTLEVHQIQNLQTHKQLGFLPLKCTWACYAFNLLKSKLLDYCTFCKQEKKFNCIWFKLTPRIFAAMSCHCHLAERRTLISPGNTNKSFLILSVFFQFFCSQARWHASRPTTQAHLSA